VTEIVSTPTRRQPLNACLSLSSTRAFHASRAGDTAICTSHKYPAQLKRFGAQARSTAQVLEAAQEDRRSTDARALLDSVEASLRQQPSGPTKVRFDRIIPSLVLRRPPRLSATLCESRCPNPGARGSQTRVRHRNAADCMLRRFWPAAARICECHVSRHVSYARRSRVALRRGLEDPQTCCERYEA